MVDKDASLTLQPLSTNETSRLTSPTAGETQAGTYSSCDQAPVSGDKDSSSRGSSDPDLRGQGRAMGSRDAALFITAELAGAGLLALSQAVANIGVFGVVLIIVCAGMAAYTGSLLGRTWVFLEQSDTSLSSTPVRQPYAEMGRRTYGHWLGSTILTLMNMTLFGMTVVLLLVSSELIEALTGGIIDLCIWLILVTVFITPFTWLGSPKHLQVPSLVALVSIILAAILILILMLSTYPEDLPAISLTPKDFRSFSLGLSTIMFSFTGVSTLPTIQLDMKDRTKLGKATVYGFFGLCLLYVPVAVSGYIVFGDEARTNITDNLTPGILLTVTQVLLVIHYMGALIMLINPVCQNLEEAWQIPFSETLTIRRISLRSGLMLIALFIAETIPSFGKIMNLIGGSFTLLLTFILPSIIYIRLRGEYRGKSKHGFKRYVVRRIFLLVLILLSVMVSLGVIFFSVEDIVRPGTLQLPCYLQLVYTTAHNINSSNNINYSNQTVT